MTILRRGFLFGVLCAALLGATDLHVHWDFQQFQDCAICQTVDQVRAPARSAPSDVEARTPETTDANPATPGSQAGAVVGSPPRSRGPPS